MRQILSTAKLLFSPTTTLSPRKNLSPHLLTGRLRTTLKITLRYNNPLEGIIDEPLSSVETRETLQEW